VVLPLFKLVHQIVRDLKRREMVTHPIESALLQPHGENETPAALWQIVGACGQEKLPRTLGGLYLVFIARQRRCNGKPRIEIESQNSLFWEPRPKVACGEDGSDKV
jgi:hypothetical protein